MIKIRLSFNDAAEFECVKRALEKDFFIEHCKIRESGCPYKRAYLDAKKKLTKHI